MLALCSLFLISNIFAQDNSLALNWAVHYSPQKSVHIHKVVESTTNHVYTIGQYTNEHLLTTTGATKTIAPKEKHQVAFLQQLNKEGQLLWRKEYSVVQKEKENAIWLLDLVHNQAEESYVLGAFQGQVLLEGKSLNSPDKKTYFIQKINKNGQVLSTQYLATHLKFAPQSMQLNATQQYLYLVGTTITKIEKNRSKLPTIQKRTLGGEIVWNKKLQSSIPNPNGNTKDFVLDAQDNLYILGDFKRSLDFDPASDAQMVKSIEKGSATFILKLDKTGQLQWVQTLTDVYGHELALDTDDNVHWVGVATADLYQNSKKQTTLSLSGNSDIVLQKIASNGQVLGTKLIHKDENEADSNPSVVISDDNTIFVSWITTVYDKKPNGLIEDYNKFTTHRHLIQLDDQLEEKWDFAIKGGHTPLAYMRLVGSPTQKHILYYGTAPVGADIAPGSNSFVASISEPVHFIGKLGTPIKLTPVNRNGMTATPESGLRKGDNNITNLKGASLKSPNQTTNSPNKNRGKMKLQKTPAVQNPSVKYPVKK